MTYLLDVNALLSLVYREHEFHRRVAVWVKDLSKDSKSGIASCAITELGVVRILPQIPEAAFTVAEACRFLAEVKSKMITQFSFITDDHGIDRLPKWAKTIKQTTDGHLAELARAHEVVLATLDERIPGAFVIPR